MQSGKLPCKSSAKANGDKLKRLRKSRWVAFTEQTLGELSSTANARSSLFQRMMATELCLDKLNITASQTRQLALSYDIKLLNGAN
ncbi:hypothetical protein J6590_090449 [Homalodisca vitripennis]|nr:hypothetical protein J6590_090449 [Homalodisca vitripennis]